MRDPKRIPAIIKRLERVWLRHPDLRLSQIVQMRTDILLDSFYMEDESLIAAIESVIETAQTQSRTD